MQVFTSIFALNGHIRIHGGRCVCVCVCMYMCSNMCSATKSVCNSPHIFSCPSLTFLLASILKHQVNLLPTTTAQVQEVSTCQPPPVFLTPTPLSTPTWHTAPPTSLCHCSRSSMLNITCQSLWWSLSWPRLSSISPDSLVPPPHLPHPPLPPKARGITHLPPNPPPARGRLLALRRRCLVLVQGNAKISSHAINVEG